MVTDKTIRPATTTAWLVERLRAAILAGELAEGAPVRQEDIAARFDVSRMPVHEALGRLEVEGWLEHRPYKGARVAPLDADDVREVFAIRAALEALAARRAFPALGAQDIAAIERALATLEGAEDDDWFAANRALHASLYPSAGPRLVRLIEQHLA